MLTTPEGADVPADAKVEQFPVLVRLHRDFFDFAQAKPDGEDLRFSLSSGARMAFQIEEWDAANGVSSVWVRVPLISGNTRQEITLHWGNANATSESDGQAVFNESNGCLSVWHMSDPVRDDIGTLTCTDTGTTAAEGVIGAARHFADLKGVFCGDMIPNYPTGASSHSTEVWFRPERPNSTLIAWGNELVITHIFPIRPQPQRGLTTKPGVAVTTAHPRKNRTKSSEPQRGSTLPGQFFRFSFSIGSCRTPLAFGVIPISLPGVHRNAATPGFVVKPFQG